MKINDFGILYIVATPLGNLQDMSFRAIETLKRVDCIAAEDTRHSQPLLKHFGIATKMVSLHEHNEQQRLSFLVDRLQAGESIGLISDAGTPLISDPGYTLVAEARKLGITVVPIPGPCAAIAALSASGLATDQFVFEGFLSTKTKLRRERLENLIDEPRTTILYEAPHRILELLHDLQHILGDNRRVVIARELTKRFETIKTGTLKELCLWVESDKNQQRGEIVLLIEGAKRVEAADSADPILTLLLAELPLKKAVAITEKITGQKKNTLYQRALQLKKTD